MSTKKQTPTTPTPVVLEPNKYGDWYQSRLMMAFGELNAEAKRLTPQTPRARNLHVLNLMRQTLIGMGYRLDKDASAHLDNYYCKDALLPDDHKVSFTDVNGVQIVATAKQLAAHAANLANYMSDDAAARKTYDAACRKRCRMNDEFNTTAGINKFKARVRALHGSQRLTEAQLNHVFELFTAPPVEHNCPARK
jgi:hypothetical protein